MLKLMGMQIECSLEHNLPDSPFASPTKGAGDYMSAFSNVASEANDTDSLATSNIGLGTLDMGTFKSYNCQMPRYATKFTSTVCIFLSSSCCRL